MRVVTRKALAAEAAEAWRVQYEPDGWRILTIDSIPTRSLDIYNALLSLGSHPTPEDVDRIIGNYGWTSIVCHECNHAVENAFVIEGSDWSCHVCENCLTRALSILQESNH